MVNTIKKHIETLVEGTEYLTLSQIMPPSHLALGPPGHSASVHYATFTGTDGSAPGWTIGKIGAGVGKIGKKWIKTAVGYVTKPVHCLTLRRGGRADSDFGDTKGEQTKLYSRINTKVAQT